MTRGVAGRRGRVVVITGASSGIGRATAVRFARSGARLVLASRDLEALTDTALECRALGADAVTVPTDVAHLDEVEALAATAVQRFGRIDVWVNDAAVMVFGEFLDVPLAHVRRVLDVDVMGVVHGARAALPRMMAQGTGVIVNIASVVAELPQPYSSSYGMAKAAVRAFGVSLRQELRLAGIRGVHVTTVSPPTTDTPIFRTSANLTGRAGRAMPPIYSPERVARAVVRASRHPRRDVVVGVIANAAVRAHRIAPHTVDSVMAYVANAAQLAIRRRVPHNEGYLFAPQAITDATITDGWHGATRTTARRIAGWSLGIAAVVTLARVIRSAPGHARR